MSSNTPLLHETIEPDEQLDHPKDTSKYREQVVLTPTSRANPSPGDVEAGEFSRC